MSVHADPADRLVPVPEVRRDLASDYLRVRRASTELTKTLEPEDCVVQTILEVSPSKWHLAHVTWFFEQFCLREYLAGYKVYNEHFAYLFNSYYQTVGRMHERPQRGLLSRPLLHDVLAYRDHVDTAMSALIDQRSGDPSFSELVTLGIHHEQQHQELMLTDIKHVFFTNPLGPAYAAATELPCGVASRHEFLPQAGGSFEVGSMDLAFSFDNETPRHMTLLMDHEIGNRLITNGEYRAFIEDGAYLEPDLWLSDGWTKIIDENWNRPLYWSEELTQEFTLSGWRSLNEASPVCHVSFYEADAFARWSNARLPTEQEWEVVAKRVPVRGNTLDTGMLHPATAAASDHVTGEPLQLWGDVWEWTASPYIPYPGFKPLDGSLGEYNGKFMVNQLVVRGGSCATWAEHLRASYRSFFRPHDRWQFLGFRLARDAEPSTPRQPSGSRNR